MKQKKISGEDINKTTFWDIPIELIKSFKELIIHLIRSETIPLVGKINLILMFVFGLAILFTIIQQFIKDVTIPLLFYIFIVVGIMSCMIAGTSLERIESKRLENRIYK